MRFGNKPAITPGLVVLVCASGHNHQMAPEQALKLHAERCCWCGEAMRGVYLRRTWPTARAQLERELCRPTAA